VALTDILTFLGFVPRMLNKTIESLTPVTDLTWEAADQNHHLVQATLSLHSLLAEGV
jgi:hypothetical protein